MQVVLMELDGLAFCSTRPEDLDRIIEIEKDNSRYVFNWSRERHLRAIEAADEQHIAIKLRDTYEIVGYILLYGIGSTDGVIEFRRIVVADKGRGFGSTSTRFIKKYSFEVLKCHRLWLDVYQDNEKAIALYEREGFIREGLLRECKKHGDGYRSMLVMSMLEQEYARGGKA